MNLIDSIEITDLTPRGGVGRLEGKAIFIADAVPGDVVQARIIADKERYFVGELATMVTPSPDRQDSPCPWFPACGGCDALHVQVDALRRLKLRSLGETLARFAGIDPALVSEIKSVGEYQGSRNKLTFHLEFEAGKAIWGFHRRGTHDMVGVEKCYVEEEGCRRAREELFAWADPARLLAWGCKKVMVRAGTDAQQTVFFLPRNQWKSVHAVIPSDKLDSGNGIWFATPEGKRWELAWGERYLPLKVSGMTYLLRGGTFFQVHTGVASLLLDDVLANLPGGNILLDLYCGLGFFGMPLAERYSRIIGIETDSEALADGKHLAEVLGINNVELLPGRLEERLPHLALNHADAAVVDPPRSGMEPAALEALVVLKPQVILYVSCHPSTLARDLLALVQHGYRVTSVTGYDMFPSTLHVEALVRLELSA
jgi:23S rRNA (uracil1939-C5)-methyltransferase